jgi:hypothetical protein
MASFSSSTFGSISGRHGTAVAAVNKNGNNVLRLYRKPSNPNSPKQLSQRMKFSVVTKGLAPLREVIKMGCKDSGAFPKVLGKVIHEAVTGEYPDFTIDFSKVHIALGTLQSAEGATAHVTEGTPNNVDFSWNTMIGFHSQLGSENDRVNIVCFNENTLLVLPFFNVATRAEGAATVTLPEIWQGNNIHCWIYFSSPDERYNSNSVYVATILL